VRRPHGALGADRSPKRTATEADERAEVRGESIRARARMSSHTVSVAATLSERSRIAGTIPAVQIARELGIHRSTVVVWIQTGQCVGTKVDGRWYVDPRSVRPPKNRPSRRQPRICPSHHLLATTLADWGEGTSVELAADVGLNDGHVRRLLIQMQLQGLASKEGDGSWRLTDFGWEWLSSTPPPTERPSEVKRGKSRP
jgi:hypothetical protein